MSYNAALRLSIEGNRVAATAVALALTKTSLRFINATP